MDGRARDALQSLVRAEVSKTLDEFAGELMKLRRQVTVLQRMAGMPTAPQGQLERRERTAALRQEGYSVRTIAATVGADRNTVTADLRLLGVEPPAGEVVGLDGRVTRPRVRSVNGHGA